MYIIYNGKRAAHLDSFLARRQLRLQVGHVVVNVPARVPAACELRPQLSLEEATAIDELDVVKQHTLLLHSGRKWLANCVQKGSVTVIDSTAMALQLITEPFHSNGFSCTKCCRTHRHRSRRDASNIGVVPPGCHVEEHLPPTIIKHWRDQRDIRDVCAAIV